MRNAAKDAVGGDASRGAARVWIVSQWYAPEPVANPRNITRALTARGMDVRVLTGYPNYPDGVVHEGYGHRWFSAERIEDVPVSRCPLYPSHGQSAVGRLANYVSWAFSAGVAALTRFRRRDVAVVYSSPATAAWPAMVCRLFRGTRYVLVVQDVWPDSVVATGFVNRRWLQALVTAALAPFVSWAYRLASHVTVSSPGMIDLLAERGVPSTKLSLTYNWADETVYAPRSADPDFRATLGIPDEVFLIMYAGNLGPAQALEDVISALGFLGSNSGVELVVIGTGVAENALREQADKVAAGRVHFVAPRPPSDMSAIMAAADLQLVTLRDEALFSYTTPSKLQSILASGQPLIAVATGDVRSAVELSGAGWTTSPGSPNALAACLLEASRVGKDELRARGLAGKRFYSETMSEAVNGSHLFAVVEGTLGELGRST